MNDPASIDLPDIQGIVIKEYPRLGLIKGRYLFFSIQDEREGRSFITGLLPMVTTGAPWAGGTREGIVPPDVAVNIGFTFDGLRHLGLPQASMQSFPEEFAMGMRARKAILGDDGPSDPSNWDPIWQRLAPVDVFVAIAARTEEHLEQQYKRIIALQSTCNTGVSLLNGHRGPGGDDLPYQSASLLQDAQGLSSRKEHFGFADGIGNPYFIGTESDPANVIGGGKVTGKDVTQASGWQPIETGEFLLGHKDEAKELPPAPIPWPLSKNGTFLVYRKLHQNVGSFDAFLERMDTIFPGGKEALAAKMVGRWRNGAPITTFPTQAAADELARTWKDAEHAQNRSALAEVHVKLMAYDYRQDLDGGNCPIGAHVRRAHPRAGLEQGVTGAFQTPDALSNRRRLLRRGLPYGDSRTVRENDGDHGVVFMVMGASIQRQFEFVQQQWLNYGNDFRLGNDKDPLLGNHGEAGGRMTIEAAAKDPKPPIFLAGLKRFVEMRGGDYFFMPSMTALNMIADGNVDPT